MANTLNDHVWHIDTAATVSTEEQRINHIRMISGAATDRATITNGLSQIVWDSGVPTATGVAIESRFVYGLRLAKGFSVQFVSGTPVLWLTQSLDITAAH